MTSSENIVIRELDFKEWEQFKNIRLYSIKEEPLAFGSTYDAESQRTPEEWKNLLTAKERNWLFADNGNRLIGIIGTIQNFRNEGNHIAYIVAFFVGSAYRKQGIGKQLLEAIIQKLKKNPEITSIRLGVTITQKDALKFYEDSGFKKIYIRKNEVKVFDRYYDEYEMELVAY